MNGIKNHSVYKTLDTLVISALFIAMASLQV